MELTNHEEQVLRIYCAILSMKILTKKEFLEKLSKLSDKGQKILIEGISMVVNHYVLDNADIFLEQAYKVTRLKNLKD